MTLRFSISGIRCSACVGILESLPSFLPNQINRATLNLQKLILTVESDDSTETSALLLESTIIKKIENLGYQAYRILSDELDNQHFKLSRVQLTEVGIAGMLAGNIMLLSIPLYSGAKGSILTFFEWLSFVLAGFSIFYSGRSFFKTSFNQLKLKQFSIDLPITLALVSAFSFSIDSLIRNTHQLYFDSMSALIFLLLASRTYLSHLRLKASHLPQVQERGMLPIHEAIGATCTLPSQFSGLLSADGILIEGKCEVNARSFNGESRSIHLQVGDFYFSGMEIIKSSETVKIKITAKDEETRLGKILKQIEDTQGRHSSFEKHCDRFAKKLLIFITLIGFITLSYFMLQGKPQEGLIRLLCLMIVTCPCALALAIPMTYALAYQKAAAKGVIIQNPDTYERIFSTKKIAFDKTGTLTRESLQLREPKLLLKLPIKTLSQLTALTARSSHPISTALQKFLCKSSIEPAQLETVQEQAGVGIKAINSEGELIELKKPFESDSVFPEVSFFIGGTEVIRLSFEDEIDSKTMMTIQKLKNMTYELEIVSGDRFKVVKRVGDLLGIKQIAYNLSPEEKAQYVKDKIMIGDGINDLLAQKNAAVGITTQGGWLAVHPQQDAVFLKGGIHSLLDLLEISDQVQATNKKNLIFSTVYNFIGGSLAVLGLMNPLIATILMPLSAFTVFTFTYQSMKKNAPQEATSI